MRCWILFVQIFNYEKATENDTIRNKFQIQKPRLEKPKLTIKVHSAFCLFTSDMIAYLLSCFFFSVYLCCTRHLNLFASWMATLMGSVYSVCPLFVLEQFFDYLFCLYCTFSSAYYLF